VSKAIVVQARTLLMFDDMGIVQESLDQGLRVHAANIYSGGRRLAHLGLASVDSSYNFALGLAQDETERRRLTERISELNINYRTSPVVAGHQGRGFGNLWLSDGPYPGDRAPEASPVRSTKTGATSLFDVLRSTKHTLLLFAGVEPEADTWKHLDTVAEQVRDRYGKHIQVRLATRLRTAPRWMKSRS
jgi:hypothetical protein